MAPSAKRIRHHCNYSKEAAKPSSIWLDCTISLWKVWAFTQGVTLRRSLFFRNKRMTSSLWWIIHTSRRGAGVVLYNPDGVSISLSFKLEFPCSSNIAEYEALLLGLISTLRLGVKRLRVQGDSKLIIEQVNGEFALKEVVLVEYRTAIQKLIKSFSSIQFEHVPRAQNKHADDLATLASKVDIPEEEASVKIMTKTLRATATELIPEVLIEEEDWRAPIIQKSHNHRPQ